MNVDEWEQAISALKSALNYGVKNRKATNTMIGMSYLNLEKLSEARASFVNAGGSGNWIKYIDRELERIKTLSQDVDMKVIEKNELLESIDSTQLIIYIQIKKNPAIAGFFSPNIFNLEMSD